MADTRLSMHMQLGILLIAVVLSLLLGAFLQARVTNSIATVKADDCGTKMVKFLNVNMVAAGTKATLVTVNEDHGVYQIVTLYQAKEVVVYATKDCQFLFPGGIDIGNVTSHIPTATQTTPVQTSPVKTDKPVVDLYIMSFCPYGVQAETAMFPVMILLGNKTDINIKFITSSSGTTVNSLHGPAEADEDMRQAVIQKYMPDMLWPYLVSFNVNCYQELKNETALAACRNHIINYIKLDERKIIQAQDTEGLALIKADEADAQKNAVSGSPTLIINGVRYSGARTSEAYKQAICNSFTTKPAECNTNLTSTAPVASGNCG